MSDESSFWDDLRGVLPKGHYVRVENPCDPGTPDVSFCLDVGKLIDPVEGWIELKYTDKLPLEHPVLATQKIWIRKRLRYGGNILFAVGIGRQAFFIPGAAAPTLNDWTYDDYLLYAVGQAENRRDQRQVQKAFLTAIESL